MSGKRVVVNGIFGAVFGAALFGVSLVPPALGAEADLNKRLDAQDKKIDAVEKKLDQLFELLTKHPALNGPAPAAQGKATGQATASADAAAPAATLKPGLLLDVWQVDAQDGKNDASELPNAPTGINVGTLVSSDAPVFNYAAFQKDANFRSFARGRNGKWVGQYWRGQLQLPSSGTHVFNLEAVRMEMGEYFPCRVVLSVGGEKIAGMRFTGYANNGKEFLNDQGVVELPAGTYEFGLWQVCNTNDSDIEAKHFKHLTATVKMKGPNDMRLAPIPGELFGH